MRRLGVRDAVGLGVIGALAGGCLGQNPAWNPSAEGGESGEASTSVVDPSTPTSTAAPTTTTAAPTTGGSLEGTGADEGSSGAASTSGAPGTTTGEAGSSEGPPVLQCMASEVVPVALAPDKIEDAGLAPDSFVPCAWAGMCQNLNFGRTEYFRMVSTAMLGKTAGLFRFNVGSLEDWLESVGRDPADLLGFEFELVVYEPRDLPATDALFNVEAIAQVDTDYPEGVGTEDMAVDGDSSGACKTLVQGACVQWSQGKYPGDAGTLLGTITVNAETVAAHDYDGMGNGVYHALLRSTLLPIDLIRAVSGGGPPTFMVTLATPRGMEPGEEIGIKFEESPEKDPALHARFCTEWGG